MREGSGHTRWRFLIGAVCLALAVSVPAIALGATLTPVYRFYNTKTGTHFYTASETEKATVQNTMGATYTFEGVAYNLETDNPLMNTPLYRFYNKVTGTHFYTASETEKNNVMATMAATFTYEGVAYNVSSTAAGTTPVYRFYNVKTGTHFYTASESEKANIQATLSGTYTFEGAAFYLAYSAAPPTGDVTAPTTTSNVLPLYRGPATILLSAADNAGGSGVAATYYTLDGFGPVAGTSISASGFGPHTIEFWSVDVAGNEETPHNIATFDIVSVHASPEEIVACTDCHTADIMTLHSNNCVYCHGTGITPSFDCADCHEPADSLDTHPSLGIVHDATASACTDAQCHAVSVTDIHGTNCAACHGAGITPTLDCATCHTTFHTAIPAAHDATGQTCIGAGCHVSTDAPTIHAGACLPCHAVGETPSVVCADCHEPKESLNTHPLMPTKHDATGESCVAAGCHDTDVSVIHDIPLIDGTAVGCAACHAEGVTPSTVCADCHGDYTVYHPAQGATVHRVTGFCYNTGCHVSTASNVSDVGLIHASWANPPGCAACHATGVTPTLTCFDAACHGAGGATMDSTHAYAHPSAAGELSEGCTISECHGTTDVLLIDPGHAGCSCHTYDSAHLNEIIGAGKMGDYAECMDCHSSPFEGDPAVHPYHIGDHDAVTANVAGTNSEACVACHGNDVMAVAPGEHAGCSCHAHYSLADLTTVKSECVECHTGGAAPHGFTNGDAAWNPNDYFAASGHNTPTFGKLGAYTKFDGSEGVTIRDSSDAVITAEYPLPSQNVFWEADDPDAPAGAMTGLTWTSVVTCEDCHTGLVDFEVDGPHGAQIIANAGIDPAYPGDYATAALWAWSAPAEDGTLDSTVTSITPMAAKSGIIQYIPGGPTPTAPSAYALKTYLDATTTIPGPAVVTGPDSVICAKCHDLHNPGTGHGATGDGDTGDGYAHYHGHDYHDNPVAYAGLYEASDETTYTAFAKRDAADVELMAASAGRGASGHCRNCHVAIPHGWKRPRLLVYETDPAPYNIGPSVEYAAAEAEGRVRSGVGEAGQLKGISSTLGPEISHAGEVGEYVNWQNGGVTTCQACGHHTAVPTPGNMWE